MALRLVSHRSLELCPISLRTGLPVGRLTVKSGIIPPPFWQRSKKMRSTQE